MLFEHRGGVGADFLLHFTQAGVMDAFAMINTALRHLPGFGAIIQTLAGKYQIVCIQQKNADARPVWPVFIRNFRRCHDAGFRFPKIATPRIKSSARASW